MTRFLNHLAASALSTMLLVLTSFAQDAEVTRSADEKEPSVIEKEISQLKEAKEVIVKKSSRRSRSSSSVKTTYDDITMIGGSPVWIKLGESAREVVVFGSDVQVDGTVKGNLVVLFGNVRLGAASQVAFGPIVLGGNLISEPGAKLGLNPTALSLSVFGGMTNVISPFFIESGRRWITEGIFRARPLPPRLPLAWVGAGFLLLFFVLIGIIFQKPVTATVDMLDQKPGSAFLLGLLVCALTLPLLLLLLASVFAVVGVVLLPLGVCALGVLFLIGKVAVYRFVGQTLGTQLGLSGFQNPLPALLAGALLFYVAYAVPVIGAMVWLLVIPMGVGAVVLASFHRAKPAGNVPVADLGVPVPDLPSNLPGVTAVVLPRVGFWLRFVATVVDFALVALVMAVILPRPKWFLLVWTVYHLALWSSKGTTVGGILFGLRIVRTDGRAITFPVAVVRLLGSFFSAVIIGLGFFWAGWTQSCQSWHDKIAGTVVVRHPKSTPLL